MEGAAGGLAAGSEHQAPGGLQHLRRERQQVRQEVRRKPGDVGGVRLDRQAGPVRLVSVVLQVSISGPSGTADE